MQSRVAVRANRCAVSNVGSSGLFAGFPLACVTLKVPYENPIYHDEFIHEIEAFANRGIRLGTRASSLTLDWLGAILQSLLHCLEEPKRANTDTEGALAIAVRQESVLRLGRCPIGSPNGRLRREQVNRFQETHPMSTTQPRSTSVAF